MAQKDLNSIVEKMLDAGESEDNIALVIKHFKDTEPSPAPNRAMLQDVNMDDIPSLPTPTPPEAPAPEKESPSLAQIALPGTTKYVNEARDTGGGIDFLGGAPKRQPGQSDEEHVQNVEAWQTQNRGELQKAAKGVIGDATSALSRTFGTAGGALGHLFGSDLPSELMTGKKNATIKESMAEPSTSLLRPVSEFGKEQLDKGNTLTGVGALAVGSLDTPGLGTIGKVAGGATKAVPIVGKPIFNLTTPVIKKTMDLVKDGMANAAAPMSGITKVNRAEKITALKGIPAAMEKDLTRFITDPTSKYADIATQAKKIAEANKIDPGHLQDALFDIKNSFMDSYNKRINRLMADGRSFEAAQKMAHDVTEYRNIVDDFLTSAQPKITQAGRAYSRSSNNEQPEGSDEKQNPLVKTLKKGLNKASDILTY